MASAMTAVLILIGGAMGEDVDFADKLATPIVLIGLATLWVVYALRALEHWLDRQ